MKIGIVCPYDIHRPGGVQAHILDCAAHMASLGHEVRILAPGPADEDYAGPVPILHFGDSRPITFNETSFELSLMDRAEKRRAAAVLAAESFDVVHFHTIWTPFMAFQLFRRTPATTARVATFHDTPPDSFSGRMTKRVFWLFSQYLLRRLDRVLAVSPSPAAHLARVPGREVALLPPTIDYSRYRAPHGRMPGHGADGRVTILYLSRLEARKGVFVLLEAYRCLAGEGAPARLVIAGDGEDRPAVDVFIAEHGLDGVELVGRVDEADKLRWYATADIFCAPATHGESFGIVLVEAMASGTPVVAARNAGFASVLTGPGAGYLATPGDASDLHDRLADLIEDPEARAALGAWGREEAMRHDVTAVVPKLLTVYEDAIRRCRAGR